MCIVLDLAIGALVYKASVLNRLGSRCGNGCSSMQGIYARLTGGSICLLYICIILDVAVDVAVWKESVLD